MFSFIITLLGLIGCVVLVIFFIVWRISVKSKDKSQRLLSTEEMETILSKVEFLNFKFVLSNVFEHKVIISIICHMPDNNDRSIKFTTTQFCYIYNKDLKNELTFLNALRKGIIRWTMHEVAEIFKYDNKDIFNTHFHITNKKRLDIIRGIIDL